VAKSKKHRLISGQDDQAVLDQATPTVVGVFRGHRRGFGFVIPQSPDKAGDLFIPPGFTRKAMTGDTVVARVMKRPAFRGRARVEDIAGRVEAEIVEILERGQSRFVGRLSKDGRRWLVVPDGKVLDDPIEIPDVKATRARTGDQVVVEITEYPVGDRTARGAIVEVLGRSGDPEIDIVSIIRQYHLRVAFEPDALHEARAVVGNYDHEKARADRLDMRDEVVITIDPDDARDFDDAISIRVLDSGHWELGVHIADVSHFVKVGGALDTEAKARGNSVYFPRHVLPMLPEVLSNGLCSLQEDQDRLAKSVFIEYDTKGRRLRKRYANTVIRSNHRLTYLQAAAILDGQTDDASPQVVGLLKRMDRLARRIQKRRIADGMIVLDLPEIDLVLDDQDRVVHVAPSESGFPHTIIEMFMVEANEAVAELFSRLRVPHLRRIHPEPPSGSQAKLARFLRIGGRKLPDSLDREALLKLLASVRGKPESFTVNLAVLRSMAQAEYSPVATGHFALASKHYSHFTSPIRRYPDLVIHRLLQMYLEGKLKTPRLRHGAPSEKTLSEIGRHCSYTERHAEAAERELRLIKILRLLEQRLGDIEEGVVTGVTRIGLFVQLRRYLVDGLVRFGDLPDDWWDVDVNAGCVVGRQREIRIGIGDILKVQIANVDITIRELDLAVPPNVFSKRGKKGKAVSVSKGGKSHVAGERKASTRGRGRHRRS
jgi:ribonuclease R